MRKKLLILFAVLIIAGCNRQQEEKLTIGFPETSTPPDWSKNMSIYEANIRQHTPEGTFRAFINHLDSINNLGVEIVWLMPIFPISEKFRKADPKKFVEDIDDPNEKNKYLGSYYSTRDYMAVNPDLGTEDDLRSLIHKAHNLGMKVILDIAVNHTGWDNKWITTNPEYYTQIPKGSTPWNPEWMKDYPEYYAELSKLKMTYPIDGGETDWWDTADLNYDNEDLRNEMIDILKYWVQEFDIDGYRCDMAMKVPTDFWETARTELDKIKPVFMLAEAEEVDLMHYAFDMNYSWELLHLTEDIAKESKTAKDIKANLEKDLERFGTDTYRMRFITNHDENSWAGTVFERYGDGMKAFAALTATIPGMPLIYSGQEAGLNKRLRFFEKDTIEWKENELRAFYTILLNQKKHNKSLYNGINGGDLKFIDTSSPENVLAFEREKDGDKILAIFNLSNKAIDFTATFNSDKMTDLFGNEGVEKISQPTVTLAPWEFIILTNTP